jgi:uncharacterized protein (TIGR02271 family)
MAILVTGKDGLSGTVVRTDAGQTLIELDQDKRTWVPSDVLKLQDDGNYFLPLSLSQLEARDLPAESIVLPVVGEELAVQKEQVTTGVVRVKKVVREREEVVNEPLLREEVTVERVLVNRVLETPAEPRQDGDTLIIPVMEEVLVLEKRLMLREEVRITRRQSTTNEPQHVTLRQEEAIVERTEPKDSKANAKSGR